MPVGSSSITMRAIFNEINATSHNSSATITDCKMSEFNADSVTYTSGTANHTGVNTTNDVEATPDTIAEWAGYTHTQSFGTPTYYVRTGTGTSDFCVDNAITVTDYEATAVCNTTFYFKLNGTVVEFYMDPDHTKQYFPQFGGVTVSRTVSARDTGGSVASFTGNFTNGFTPMKIAQLDVGSVSGLQARISATIISGTGTYDTAVSGYTISSAWQTPSSTLYGISPAAWTLPQGCFSSQTRAPYHRLTMEVKATGYNTKTLNNFVSSHSATAISDDCV